MAATRGLGLNIGGDWKALQKALKDSEAAVAASARRQEAITKDLAERESRVFDTALDHRIKGIRAAEAEAKKAIQREIADEQRKAEMILRLERATQAEIKQVRRAALTEGMQALAGLGAGVGVGLGLTIKQAADAFGKFEAEMQGISAVAGVTGKDLDALRAQALALGAATKFSATEAAQGMAELARSGMNAAQVAAAIPGVLALAAAGGVSIAEAASLAGGTLNGFSLAADQAGRVADVMAQAANKSAVGISDLSNTMKYVAPVASSAGQGLEDMASAIAVMGKQMVVGEQAGTTLRGALVRLLDPPKEAAAELNKLGISIQNQQGKMLPLRQIIDQLRTATAKMTETDRAAALSRVFGTEALSGMMALVRTSKDDYDLMTASMKASEGAAARMAAIMNQGLNPALEQAGGAVETLSIKVGDALAPSIVAGANAVGSLADAFSGLPGPAQSATAGLLVAGAAGSGFLVVGAGIVALWPALVAGAVALGSALPPIGAGLALVALAAGTATAALSEAARAESAAAVQAEETHKGRLQAVTDAAKQEAALARLVDEHDKLTGKTRLSKEEQKRLKEIQNTLQREYPDLAAAVKKAGDSHWGNVTAINAEITALRKLKAEQLGQAQMDEKKAQKAFDAAWGAYDKAAGAPRVAGATGGEMFGGGFVDSSANTAAAKEAAALTARNAAAKALQDAKSRVAEIQSIIKPPKIEDEKTGGVVPAGSGSGRSKADQAERRAIAQEEAILAATKRASEARAKADEAAAERTLAASKAANAAALADLDRAHAAGLLDEERYQLDREKLILAGVDIDTNAAKARVAIERKTANDQLAETRAALAKLGTSKTAAAEKERTKLLSQEAALVAELRGYGDKAGAEEDRRQAARVETHKQTTAAILAATQKSYRETWDVYADLADKDKASQRELRDARIAALEGTEQAMAKAEAAYADALDAAREAWKTEIGRAEATQDPGTAKAIVDQAEKTRKTAEAAALLRKQVDVKAVVDANTKSLQQMQAALVALAFDPSIERLANFLRDFANPATQGKLLEGISTTFGVDLGGKISPLLDAAGEAGENFRAVRGEVAGIVDLAGGPLNVALGGVSLVSKIIADEWQRAASYATEMASVQQKLDDIAAEGDPEKWRENEYQKAEARYKASLATIRGQVRSELGAKANAEALGTGRVAPLISEADVDAAMKGRQDAADALALFEAEAAKIEKERDDRQAARTEAAGKAIEEAVAAGKKTAEEAAKGVEEAFGRIQDAQERIADVTKQANDLREEFERGDLNNRGEKIGVLERARLDTAEAIAAWAKKKADYDRQDREAQQALLDIESDRVKARQGILDEGIAVRAKTEYEDKIQRLAQVDAEAAAKVKAVQDAQTARDNERAEAQADYDDTIARIANIAQAKQEQHEADMARLDAVRRQNDILLAQEQARLAVALTVASLGGNVISQSAWSTATTKPKFHTGGIVPGPAGADVPALVAGGEMVITGRQQADLWEWIQMAQRPQMVSMPPGYAAGGGVTVNFGDIVIQGGGNVDTRAIARQVRADLEAELRRANIRR